MTVKELCSGTTFQQRDTDRGTLFRCSTCGRVNKTARRHQVASKTTASHDKTMAILWDAAR